MALDKQVYINSIDTGFFYTDDEYKIYEKIGFLNRCIQRYTNEVNILAKVEQSKMSKEKAVIRLNKIYPAKNIEEFPDIDIRRDWLEFRIHKCKKLREAKKAKLKLELSISKGCRTLRHDMLTDKNKIGVFESVLSRSIKIPTNTYSEDIFVVRVYYYDILKDLIHNGFIYNGEKYICYTASAGQIRKKKVEFVKESIWKKYKLTLLGGLDVDEINDKGGVNTNKYLAYLALCNSATDLWDDFDIDKCIVVDDMETMVSGKVNYIDNTSFLTECREMEVPVTHTDGCGMVLPSLTRKNTMVRLPWIKGLLAVFPFDKFIKAHNCSSVVTDIYGDQYDVEKDDIQVIFTKSQFKMWKYYDNWRDYKERYKKYGCSAGTCNMERDYIPNAKLNYQMLQTLTDISDDELRTISQKTVDKINNIAHDKDSMLRAFGALDGGAEQNSFQKSLNIYPELLNDPYTRETLKEIKKSMVKKALAGHLDINGKYVFLIPDLYAFCQYLFLWIRRPKGLLKDGEVSCKVYRDVEELDCLRSPHLSREHAVRHNVVNDSTREWFLTNGIYTSCHDLISKVLQFDNDGDMSLVVADKTFVDIAKRNMQGVLPLYYEMPKAGVKEISDETLYEGMIAAYKGGNIGSVSNLITKVWNDEDIDIDLINVQCLYNNFVIDYAKTLYKPDIPHHIVERVVKYSTKKLPHFFIYAKDKTESQVRKLNDSTVNRLHSIIPNPRFRLTADNLGKFDYRVLMSDPNVEENRDIVSRYKELDGESHFRVNFNDEKPAIGYLRTMIRDDLESKFGDISYITNVLVKELFSRRKTKYKSTFWLCFGDEVLKNIENNIDKNSAQCERCGKRFYKTVNNQKFCDSCQGYQTVDTKIVKCVDCGEDFEVSNKNNKTVRCHGCQSEFQKIYFREYKRQQRANKSKMSN